MSAFGLLRNQAMGAGLVPAPSWMDKVEQLLVMSSLNHGEITWHGVGIVTA